ncbi:MAG: hypothetical protein AAFQ21_12255 [Pseudomonadota bacterium]
MVAPARKIEAPLTPAEPALTRDVAAIDAARASASPAKALQARIEAEWDGKEEKYPAIYVTSTVIVVCLASWIGIWQAFNAF